MSENVYARIAAAYKEISAQTFEKNKEVKGSGGGYKFIPIGQILEIVRKAHGNNGIIVIFGRPEYDAEQFEKRYTYVKKTEDYYTGKIRETTWTAAIGHISVKIYGENEDDYIETVVPFEAQDNSDKLTNKIMTNAERCLYRTMYAIDEGGEDPEETNYIRNDVILVEEKKPVKGVNNDPFFGKPEEKKADVSDFKTADKVEASDAIPTEEELASFINVKGALPKFKDVVKAFKIEHGAKSAYDLSFDEKVELYNIIRAMEGSS